MKITGIAAEYNPFHLGHAYHLQKSREEDPERCIVAVMSGDFVQRGEAASYNKYARAEAACRCGVDLVVELPLAWALSSAEGFARGAVRILSGIGADTIAFGAESEKLSELEEIADALLQEDFVHAVRERLTREPKQSFAAARQRTAEERLGRPLPEMKQPNNILAIEYLKAIQELQPALRPLAVRRFGAEHDSAGEGGILSAKALRTLLAEGNPIDRWIPEEAAIIFGKETREGRQVYGGNTYERVLLSRLRSLQCGDFCELHDAEGGLGQKLFNAFRTAGSMEEIIREVSSSRYASARVRRLCLCAALGVQPAARENLPGYARILAFNGRGREILKSVRGIPVLTKTGDYRILDGESRIQVELAAAAHDFYTLCYPHAGPWPAGEDWRKGPTRC